MWIIGPWKIESYELCFIKFLKKIFIYMHIVQCFYFFGYMHTVFLFICMYVQCFISAVICIQCFYLYACTVFLFLLLYTYSVLFVFMYRVLFLLLFALVMEILEYSELRSCFNYLDHKYLRQRILYYNSEFQLALKARKFDKHVECKLHLHYLPNLSKFAKSLKIYAHDCS